LEESCGGFGKKKKEREYNRKGAVIDLPTTEKLQIKKNRKALGDLSEE